MIEFICEGCGISVTDIIGEAVPAHQLCAVCRWICEEVPGPEGMRAYDAINRHEKEATK